MSETFVSVQGEGKSLGQPASFLRLARCNLECSWCDTPYSWDFERYSFAREVTQRSFSELTRWAIAATPYRLIITGGEPLLQRAALSQWLTQLDESSPVRFFVEVETNGTIPPNEALWQRVDQWNVSPKLAGSGELERRRVRPKVLGAFAQRDNSYFKFVIDGEADRAEARNFNQQHGLNAKRVFYMPQAQSRAELQQRQPTVAGWAVRDGVALSTRLHLTLFDGQRGT